MGLTPTDTRLDVWCAVGTLLELRSEELAVRPLRGQRIVLQTMLWIVDDNHPVACLAAGSLMGARLFLLLRLRRRRSLST